MLWRTPLFVRGIAVGEAADPHRLRLAVVVPLETAPDLEDPHALLFAREIRAQHFDETTGERGTHHIEMTRDGVQNANGTVYRGVAGKQCFLRRRAHEAERDHLLPFACDEPRAYVALTALALGHRKHALHVCGRRCGNAIVAVQSSHFLDEVLFD